MTPPRRTRRRRDSSSESSAVSDEELVVISQLTPNVNTTHIHEIASAFGDVVKVELKSAVSLKENGCPQQAQRDRYANVYMATPQGAQSLATSMDRGQIDGKVITATRHKKSRLQ